MVNVDLLKEMCELPAVSGYEKEMQDILKDHFQPLTDDCRRDELGNFIARKKGKEGGVSIMIAAHMDEIGLMVKKIDDDGFLRISAVGGIDPRTLPGQRVCVHGRDKLKGVIGAMPPHLLDKKSRNKAHRLKDLYVDTGYDRDEIEKMVSVGDIISIRRDLQELENEYVTGKALDDRAGVLLMYECAKELADYNHEAKVFFVATSQEEVGVKGGITSAYNLDPQIGIAIDVTHGMMPGVDKNKAVEMEKGPVISFGPHVHPDLFELMKKTADDRSIPHQIQPTPSPYGTDAAGIQVARSGVATALLSIPQRYMHTSVEMLSLNNIKEGAILLASVINKADDGFVEGLTCF